jgi:hypothetical protein
MWYYVGDNPIYIKHGMNVMPKPMHSNTILINHINPMKKQLEPTIHIVVPWLK